MIALTGILARAARHFGDRVALHEDDRRWSWGGLLERAARLAGALRAVGLRPGDRVALLDRNSRLVLDLNYACALGGFVLVPLNARLASAEVTAILAEVEPQAMFVGEALAQTFRAVRPLPASILQVVVCDQAGAAAYESHIATAEPMPPVSRAADEVSHIFYTSGTTGEPKGVCLTGGNMVASALDAIAALGLGADDNWLHAAPMFHLVDAWAVWATALVGGSQTVVHFAPDAFCNAARHHKVTMTSIPPTVIDMLHQYAMTAGGADLSSFRRITYGGATMTHATRERAATVFACPLVQAYGISEASGIVTLELEPGATAGVPVPHVQLRLVDEQGQEVPVGAPGEVQVAGARVFTRYWAKPQATRQAFDGRWYRSGDVGVLDESGRLSIVGRRKEMVITGGENVYPAEVENALSQHPAVQEVAVLGLPDATWGEAVTAVVYALEQGSQLEVDELTAFCRSRIAAYKVPKRIHVVNQPLPRTGSGKLDKPALRAQLTHLSEKDT